MSATDLKNDVVLLSSRYKQYITDQRRGITSHDQQQVALAKIKAALLDLVLELPDDLPKVGVKDVPTSKKVKKKAGIWPVIVSIGVVVSILGGLAEFLKVR